MFILRNSQFRGAFLVLLSASLFGWIGYLGTELFYENFTVENMLFWRFFIAVIWISFNIMLFNKKSIQTSINPINMSTILRIFLFVTISYSCGSALYFVATKYIGTGIAMVIFFSFPLFVALIALVRGSWQMSKHTVCSLIAVVFGLVLLKGHGSHELNTLGIMIAVAAALFYAIYIYGSRANTQTMDPQLLTLITCIGSAAFFWMWSYFSGSFFIPGSWRAWFYICSIGILGTALPIQLLLMGLKNISPIKASILSVLEPVVTMLVGASLLGETISFQQGLGIIIVLLGAMIIQFERLTETRQ